MITNKIQIKDKLKFNCDGTLEIFHAYDDKPIILILPGGGYHHLSPREATPVSNKFLEFGYNTAILSYSVAPFQNPTQLIELEYSIKFLKKTYKDIFVMGFSAGGHLAGLGGTSSFNKYIKGLILCYPVISFITSPHKGTIKNFFNNVYTKQDLIDYSIDKRINKKTPTTFIWSTKQDKSVPFIHTELMAKSLEDNNIQFEKIIFNTGKHGLALADETAVKDNDISYINNEVSIWPSLVNEFIKKVISR